MNPREFAEVAELFAGGGPFPEGRHRSAVSRFYYAAFLSARDQLILTGVFTRPHKGPESHEHVVRAFAFSDDPPARRVGAWLRELKKLRTTADYEIAGAQDTLAVTEARQLMADVEAALPTVTYPDCYREAGW